MAIQAEFNSERPPDLAEALHAGEVSLGSFFDHAPFQMGITELTQDHDMLLVRVNHAAAASMGFTAEGARGKRISELGLPGPHRGVWLDEYMQALQSRSPVHFEHASGLPGGEKWWAVTLAYIGTGPSGQSRFSYVSQDITRRRQDEKTQAALLRISEAAQSAPTLPELFRQIHEIIGELLPARNFFVALYDEKKDELTFPYYVDEYDSAPEPRKLDDGTLSGRVIQTGQALLFTPDTPNEGIHEELTVIGTASLDWLGVPLKSQSQTLGALVVQSYAGDVRYGEKDKTLLEFVSGQVGTAIMRKLAEEAILASETRFRLLFEQNLAGVFRTLPDGRIMECNEAFARMLGYESRADIMAVNTRLLYADPGDRASFMTDIRAHGSINNSVTCLKRKDGKPVWCMETVNLLRNEQGEPEVFQGTLIDFSDRKHTEEALRLSETRLEEAQRVAHLGSWNWDIGSNTLSWSDELCRIYALDPEQHKPDFNDFLSRVHPDDRNNVQAVVDQALVDRAPFSHESRILLPDGLMGLVRRVWESFVRRA